MCKAGGFDSLLPMQELSVMGLVEVVPHLWQIKASCCFMAEPGELASLTVVVMYIEED